MSQRFHAARALSAYDANGGLVDYPKGHKFTEDDLANIDERVWDSWAKDKSVLASGETAPVEEATGIVDTTSIASVVADSGTGKPAGAVTASDDSSNDGSILRNAGTTETTPISDVIGGNNEANTAQTGEGGDLQNSGTTETTPIANVLNGGDANAAQADASGDAAKAADSAPANKPRGGVRRATASE